MFVYLNKKAQSTAEYVVVLGLVVAAVVAMQTYIKRGLMGRMRDAVDTVNLSKADGSAEGGLGTDDLFSGEQFEPDYTSSSFADTRDSTDTETAREGGAMGRSSHVKSTRTGAAVTSAPTLEP